MDGAGALRRANASGRTSNDPVARLCVYSRCVVQVTVPLAFRLPVVAAIEEDDNWVVGDVCVGDVLQYSNEELRL